MRAMLGVTLPILTITIFVVLLAFSLMRLSAIERDMRIDASQNMLWVLSQAHIASLQLGEAAARQPLDESGRAVLQLRYDLFLSRLALLDDGPQRRQMEKLGFAGAVDGFRERLPELEAQIADPDAGGTEQAATLLEPYNAMLGQASNKAMVAEWDDLGSRLDSSREELWQIIFSLVGISLAGAALYAHFLKAMHDARRRTLLLDKEKAFSELLIGSSGEGIVAVDLDRRCTVWNEAAERLFGLPSTRSIGRALGDVSGFFEVDAIRQAIDDALESRPASLLDQPCFASGQAEALYLDLRCFPLRDGARIIGAILLASDVTERRAAQKEIADHRDRLEQLVEARTHELDAALTRERATAELYRNFGIMISHQFRTPLAIVDSALQRLMRRRDRLTPEEVLERGGYARHSIARLTGLVESTLDAARLDAGQIEIRSQPCDLAEIVADVCARQAEQTPERTITVETAGNDRAVVCCDPFHVENILINLLSNAVKYSPADTQVTIALAKRGARIECVVSNEGRLDGEAEREALFERYFRGRNAEGRPGIGVGLYMARALARLQGGDVQLRRSKAGTVRLALLLPYTTDYPPPVNTAASGRIPA